MGLLETKIHRTVVSTFASPHEPALKPKVYKIAFASPAQLTTLVDFLRLVTKKNKINLPFTDRFVRLGTDYKMIDK